jgi:hypothetical protein
LPLNLINTNILFLHSQVCPSPSQLRDAGFNPLPNLHEQKELLLSNVVVVVHPSEVLANCMVSSYPRHKTHVEKGTKLDAASWFYVKNLIHLGMTANSPAFYMDCLTVRS